MFTNDYIIKYKNINSIIRPTSWKKSTFTNILKNKVYSFFINTIVRLALKFWHLIMIMIMLCCQHGYPWPSFATPPYRSLLLAGFQGYILYPHRAAICMFELAVLLLFGHMRGFIGVHHLWTCPCSSSSVPHVWSI